uniref:Uncharacterized protein n=1 Tax=Rhizophagus irregularis (strain DAOM 181602 / DAOM 197198 / MUCL 43194) TaxID=747089 RepID=U9UKC5_RHIID
MYEQNLLNHTEHNDIEDLFLTKRFIPFTFISKGFQLDLNNVLPAHIRNQFHSVEDNVIAEGFLIHPDPVNLWKLLKFSIMGLVITLMTFMKKALPSPTLV